MAAPDKSNDYLAPHAELLLSSYRRWLGRPLIAADDPATRARLLYDAPFVVLSHDGSPDPVFTYGNRAAQALFGYGWDELTRLPSRYSAEPLVREERERLLATVARQGYIDDYSGVRVARNGRRFLIERAVVWNLVDEAGRYLGQAASFDRWRDLPEP